MHKWVLTALLLTGCVGGRQHVVEAATDPNDPTLTALTSGAIGCRPSEVRIAEHRAVLREVSTNDIDEVDTWSATCRNRKFYCTGARITQCREELTQAPTPAAAETVKP